MRLPGLVLALLITCMAHLPVRAAEANTTAPEAGITEAAGQDASSAAQGQAAAVEEQTSAEEAGDEEESPSRFIPTEQISQDLGVSFPVDI